MPNNATCPSSEEAVNYFDVELFNALNFSFDTAVGDFNIDDFTMSLEGVNTEISQGAFDLVIDTASPAAGVDAATINSLPPPSPLPLGEKVNYINTKRSGNRIQESEIKNQKMKLAHPECANVLLFAPFYFNRKIK
ncbi:hypothetical protein K435DRAFT_812257 [Dendrothele bispora CBS 962.96]|uniref:Uncharacterized protein n=1 Tax=Dendrothele bispora (strain CBS 962.96) TaxID=1314807 RepID=A0A4S8KPX4_DENBC|nr:hypothetical protein K435DRAFT_812257 [Dendrothele bispora CBS 962.96]